MTQRLKVSEEVARALALSTLTRSDGAAAQSTTLIKRQQTLPLSSSLLTVAYKTLSPSELAPTSGR